MCKIKLTESLFPPQTNGELSDITVGELLNLPHFLEIIIDIFEEETDLSLDKKFSDLDTWDSLNVLSLLSAVDEKYGIMLDLKNMSSFRDIYELIKSKSKN